jgi:hypothetical protein
VPKILTQPCVFPRTSIRPITMDDSYMMQTRKESVFANDHVSLLSHAPLYPGMMGDKRTVVSVAVRSL